MKNVKNHDLTTFGCPQTLLLALTDHRSIENSIELAVLRGGCLVCSEHKRYFRNRPLVPKYLCEKWGGNMSVKHLVSKPLGTHEKPDPEPILERLPLGEAKKSPSPQLLPTMANDEEVRATTTTLCRREQTKQPRLDLPLLRETDRNMEVVYSSARKSLLS